MASSRALITAVGISLLGMGGVAGFLLLQPKATPNELWGVRLGDSMSLARDHFRTPAPGAWSSTAGADASLTWMPASSASPVGSARLEFHDGMMVAARLELGRGAEASQGPPLEITQSSVLARAPLGGDRTRLTLVSRSCPVHAAEVKRLLAGE